MFGSRAWGHFPENFTLVVQRLAAVHCGTQQLISERLMGCSIILTLLASVCVFMWVRMCVHVRESQRKQTISVCVCVCVCLCVSVSV